MIELNQGLPDYKYLLESLVAIGLYSVLMALAAAIASLAGDRRR
jgi:hypothetical protein